MVEAAAVETENAGPKHALRRNLWRRPLGGAVPARRLVARYREASRDDAELD
jgi:hypothetical protein